jgi:hypothetical protein
MIALPSGTPSKGPVSTSARESATVAVSIGSPSVVTTLPLGSM